VRSERGSPLEIPDAVRRTTRDQTDHLIALETRITDAATNALMMVVTGTYYIIPREAGDADGDDEAGARPAGVHGDVRETCRALGLRTSAERSS